MSAIAQVNWRLVVRNTIRIFLMPLFLIQLIIVCVLSIIPSVCAWLYYHFYARKKMTSSDEWVSAEPGPKVGGIPPLKVKHVHYENLYFTTKDGTRLAVDVWLPPKAQGPSPEKVGCVLHQARYFRSFQLWFPANIYRGYKPINFINDEYFQAFLARGMAVISMDIRGTGASFGQNTGPWLEIETADSMEVIDWITTQPWSNGKVGTWGISYEGTAALLTSMSGHPALRATAPMYIFLDVYSDVGFIGGIHLSGFLHRWEKITRMLDDNRLEKLAPLSFFALDGVMPVAGAHWSDLRKAVAEHRNNWSVSLDGVSVDYIDDTSEFSGLAALEQGPFNRVNDFIRRLKTEGKEAVKPPDFLLVSGWLDVTASCALKLAYHLEGLVDDLQLVIATWNHAGVQHARFYEGAATSFHKFKAAHEVGDFFYPRLQGNAMDAEMGGADDTASLSGQLPPPPPPVRYFNMQGECWKTPARFPFRSADNARRLYLRCTPPLPARQPVGAHKRRQAGGLVERPPADEARVTLPVDTKRDMAYTGTSRYTVMTEVYLPMRYDLDHKRVSHIRFTSPPLTEALEVTGFPVAQLYVSSSTNDASLFVYLICIDATGRPHYVTEGLLRVSSRRLVTLPSEHIMSYPGLPTPSFLRRDAQLLEPDGAPVLATVSLHPTSYTFLPGQCIALAVAGADADHFVPLALPTKNRFDLTVHSGPDCPSHILLPSPHPSNTPADHDNVRSPRSGDALNRV